MRRLFTLETNAPASSDRTAIVIITAMMADAF
jgi:hypothetical protein